MQRQDLKKVLRKVLNFPMSLSFSCICHTEWSKIFEHNGYKLFVWLFKCWKNECDMGFFLLMAATLNLRQQTIHNAPFAGVNHD